MSFSIGEFVGVPVRYAKGAFDNELMISLTYNDDTISGFVQRENLRFVDDRNALLKAEVLSIASDIRLRLLGSFFTTNGVEPFRSEWAISNLKKLEAA
jgi:hypothetical protein